MEFDAQTTQDEESGDRLKQVTATSRTRAGRFQELGPRDPRRGTMNYANPPGGKIAM